MRRVSILLLFVLLFAMPASAREEWYDYYRSAIEASNRGDHGKALELIRAALERKKRSGYLRTYGNNYVRYVPHFRIGVAQHGLGNCEEALASFERSDQLRETRKMPRLAANLRSLRAECEAALAPPPVEVAQADPEPVTAEPTVVPIDRGALEGALSFYLAGDFETAATAFGTLTGTNPESAHLHLLLGMSLHGAWSLAGEDDATLLADAREALTQARALDPGLVPDPALCPPPVAALFRSLR